MALTKWKCPKHGLKLKTIEDYPGALLCPAGPALCPDVYTEIDSHLCVNRDIKGIDGKGQWWDVKTGEVRLVSK